MGILIRSKNTDHYPNKTAIDQTFPDIYLEVLNFDMISDIVYPFN